MLVGDFPPNTVKYANFHDHCHDLSIRMGYNIYHCHALEGQNLASNHVYFKFTWYQTLQTKRKHC
jgi:hypothetical protein